MRLRLIALATALIIGGVLGRVTRVDAQASLPSCDPDNGGLTLPDGFCAFVVADNLGRARHVVVAPNGDLYVTIRGDVGVQGIVALRDTSGDGRADVTERFGEAGGTGIALHNGYLYFAWDNKVVRYRMEPGRLVPAGPAETIATLPTQRSHPAKKVAFDGKGGMFVNVGAPSNACQDPDRKAGVPGQRPCPLLEQHGGIWRFDENKANQVQADGRRYATGMRQNFALAWHPAGGGLYLVQHGRDQLNTLWPALFTDEQNAELPSEEFLRVTDGADFGWPYCYHDWQQGKRVLAPEYGGDGKAVGDCARYPSPIVAFPGHWAPNDLLFYTGSQFPEKYRGGAFIAFHGSWNRAPLPQRGYNVTFVPFKGADPSGKFEIFAEGFPGVSPIPQPGDARHRPTGLAQGPDGSLYVTDSVKGRLWRIVYRGAAAR